jgi:citrate synthase
METRYLSAKEAATALGVALPTLYAYTSRRMLRSEPVPGDPRAKRYLKEDIERLNRRREVRSNPDTASRQSLHWGGPVLESALTLIDGEHLYYRGKDAVELALSSTVEEVAALLWTGRAEESANLFGVSPRRQGPADNEIERMFRTLERLPGLGAIERCQIALPWAGSRDLAAYDLRSGPVAAAGARILTLMASVVSGIANATSVEAGLQQAWLPRRPALKKALRAALILCADHELNVSAFAARCVASAAATPYEVVSAGLAAVKGGKHGGLSARVEAMLQEVGSPALAKDAVAGRLRRGEVLPGFGHPLYPGGDPRARVLLGLAEELGKQSAAELTQAVTNAIWDLTGEHPTVDFALVALARAIGLPKGSPIVLFALGRTIGWIAHAIEQYQTEELIRPRARYVGELPDR